MLPLHRPVVSPIKQNSRNAVRVWFQWGLWPHQRPACCEGVVSVRSMATSKLLDCSHSQTKEILCWRDWLGWHALSTLERNHCLRYNFRYVSWCEPGLDSTAHSSSLLLLWLVLALFHHSLLCPHPAFYASYLSELLRWDVQVNLGGAWDGNVCACV